jgi:hypothetical protein
MLLTSKPHFRRSCSVVEGNKPSTKVTLPRKGDPLNPAASELDARAHLALSNL